MRKLAFLLAATLSATGCFAQAGNSSNSSSQSGSARHGTSDTQSDRAQPPSDGKTGSSMHDTIITSDQQVQSSYSAEQTPEGASGGGQVPAGTLVRATLDLLLTSKSSQAGDKFTATISQPVRGYDGSSLVPTGTKLEGVVTRVEQSQLESSLVGGACKIEFRFDRMVLPNGAATPVNLTLVSLKAPENKVRPRGGSANENANPESQNAPTQDSVMASGASSGSAMKGLSVTSSPGGGYVTATDASMVSLPPQSTVVLRFQHSTMVPSSALR